mmetsp:Transcript_24115/g.45089  ORF Transcript_24115/g.45089 Transcript_24115/m.45089 type:complete len:137 (-) Transcript_24115:272-682(-)
MAERLGLCKKSLTIVSIELPTISRKKTTFASRLHGCIVVNGIKASSFAYNHYAVNAFYQLHRAMHGVVPSSWLSSKSLRGFYGILGRLGRGLLLTLEHIVSTPLSASCANKSSSALGTLFIPQILQCRRGVKAVAR